MFFASCFWYQPHLHNHQKCAHSIKPGSYCTLHTWFPLGMLIPLPLAGAILFSRSLQGGISLGNWKPPLPWPSHAQLLPAIQWVCFCVTSVGMMGRGTHRTYACGMSWHWLNTGSRRRIAGSGLGSSTCLDATCFHPLSLCILIYKWDTVPLAMC